MKTLAQADLHAIVEQLPWGVLVADAQNKVLYNNPQAMQLFGDLVGRAFPLPMRTGVSSPEDGQALQIQVKSLNWQGEDAWMITVTEMEWSAQDTERLAFEDTLTGLPNLNIIRQFIDFTNTQAKRYERSAALLILDLDRFKVVNDALGFRAGDELLCQVATRLQGNIRSSDIVGRRGEDEFLILLTELTSDRTRDQSKMLHNVVDRAAAVAQRILDEFKQRSFQVQGQEFHVGVSIGISLCPEDASTAEEMLWHADSALHHAKEQGRGRLAVYSPELKKRHEQRLEVETGLHEALKDKSFQLLYLPVVDLTTGGMVGVEALLRWKRGKKLVAANEFIHVAEECGLMMEIGDWVIGEACAQTRRWLDEGLDLFTTINLSTRQVLRTDMVEHLLQHVRGAGLEPGKIQIEVREEATKVDPLRMDESLRELSRNGIQVAIDDFGVGFTSIRQLKRMEARVLKIDRSLVAGIPDDPDAALIVRAAVNLAQGLELTSLAEGIETEQQFRALVAYGCNFGQGFYFCKPQPAAEISKLAKKQPLWKPKKS